VLFGKALACRIFRSFYWWSGRAIFLQQFYAGLIDPVGREVWDELLGE
jgi:hypothetical protein